MTPKKCVGLVREISTLVQNGGKKATELQMQMDKIRAGTKKTVKKSFVDLFKSLQKEEEDILVSISEYESYQARKKENDQKNSQTTRRTKK